MKTIAGFLFLVVLILVFSLTTATLAVADEDELTPQELEVKCMEEGGCATITRRAYMQALREAVEIGRQKGILEGHRACMKKMI